MRPKIYNYAVLRYKMHKYCQMNFNLLIWNRNISLKLIFLIYVIADLKDLCFILFPRLHINFIIYGFKGTYTPCNVNSLIACISQANMNHRKILKRWFCGFPVMHLWFFRIDNKSGSNDMGSAKRNLKCYIQFGIMYVRNGTLNI